MRATKASPKNSHVSPRTSALRDTNVLAEVKNGYVTLTGEVDRPHQKQIAANRVANWLA